MQRCQLCLINILTVYHIPMSCQMTDRTLTFCSQTKTTISSRSSLGGSCLRVRIWLSRKDKDDKCRYESMHTCLLASCHQEYNAKGRGYSSFASG